MLISRIARTSRVLGKSQGYLGLPVRDEVIHDVATGSLVPAMVTAWEPTPSEVEVIRQGGLVYLRLFGTAHPPTMIWAAEPEAVPDETLRSAIPVEAVARGAVAVRDLIPNLDVEAAALVARDVWAAMLGAVLAEGAPDGAAKAAAQDADAYGRILDVLKERTGREWSLAQILSLLKDADEVR